MSERRQVHLGATTPEIGKTWDERLAGARARMLDDMAPASKATTSVEAD